MQKVISQVYLASSLNKEGFPWISNNDGLFLSWTLGLSSHSSFVPHRWNIFMHGITNGWRLPCFYTKVWSKISRPSHWTTPCYYSNHSSCNDGRSGFLPQVPMCIRVGKANKDNCKEITLFSGWPDLVTVSVIGSPGSETTLQAIQLKHDR